MSSIRKGKGNCTLKMMNKDCVICSASKSLSPRQFVRQFRFDIHDGTCYMLAINNINESLCSSTNCDKAETKSQSLQLKTLPYIYYARHFLPYNCFHHTGLLCVLSSKCSKL